MIPRSFTLNSRIAPTLLAIGLGIFASGAKALDASVIADGGPWNMQTTSGPDGVLTLQPDGTGQMRAMGMNMRVSWQAEGDRICLATRMRGNRCVTLAPSEAGYAGMEDGQLAFGLTR